MDYEVKCQAGEKDHRYPEVDFAPLVSIEAPEDCATTAAGWEYVSEEHPS